MPDKTEIYLSEKEAAALTRFCAGTLRNMRSAKRGPSYLKVGKRSVRYRQSDLENWMNGKPVLTSDSMQKS